MIIYLYKLLNFIISSVVYKFIFRPLLLGLPSFVITAYKIEVLYKSISLSSFNFFPFVEEHALVLGLSYLVLPVFVSVEDLIRIKAKNHCDTLSAEGLSFLIKAIDKPVEKKLNRFISFLKQQKSDKITSPEDVFNTITQPDIQIAEIIRSIHILFEGIPSLLEQKNDDIEFYTTLFIMENNVPVKSWCFFPESDPPSDILYKSTDSLSTHACEQKNTIIVSDIAKEKKKKKSRISPNCITEKGSAICYPILCKHTGDIPLAIRIVASSNFFNSDMKKLYQKIFEKFEKRILIEYALSEVKKYATA